MILLIDNYDSFTYNLAELAMRLKAEIRVVRNDRISIGEMRSMPIEGIILSPGPKRPENAGICIEAIRAFGSLVPILGVCLGHQAIGAAYGAAIEIGSGDHARQDEFDLPQSGGPIFTDAFAIPGRALPFARHLGRRIAGRTDRHGANGEWDDHGGAASISADIRHSVPPRIGHDLRRGEHHAGIFRHVREQGGCMLKDCLIDLFQKKDLGQAVCRMAADEILHNEEPIQTAMFLTLLRAKGETAEELAGLVLGMRAQGKSFLAPGPFVDLVGTGGDCAGTVNISTASALLAASAGARVIKHGNRAVSSKCGSADVLEALGAKLSVNEECANRCLDETSFLFCFAPDYHPALKAIRDVRRSIGLPTVLNLLGPLLNPAGLDHLVLGVFDSSQVRRMAEALQQLGTKRSIVFSGLGIDELSCLGPTSALLVEPDGIEPIVVNPSELGLKPCSLLDLKGGDGAQNAAMICNALSGACSPIADTIALNAAAALYIARIASSFREGVEIAKGVLSSGKALETLRRYCALTGGRLC